MKKRYLMIAILLLIINIVVNVNAAGNSCKLELAINKLEFEAGNTVELTLKISDIISDNGVTGISGLIEYDSSIFDKVEYEKCTNWEQPTILEDYISTFTSSYESTKENQEVLKIKLKLKNTVADGNYNVTLKGIEITTDDEQFNIEDVVTTVTVKKVFPITPENPGAEKDEPNKDEPNKDEPNKEPEEGYNKPSSDNKPAQETSNTNKDNKIKDNKVVNSTVQSSINNTNISPKSLPKAGLNTYFVAVAIIITIVGIICYGKYKKYSSIK